MAPAALPPHVRGSLLGAAIGDVVGAAFEFRRVDPQAVEARLAGPGHRRGTRYTDDTHAAIGVLQALLQSGCDVTRIAETLARRYFEAGGGSRGYGPSAPGFFARIRRGDARAAEDRFGPGLGSYGNGSAMHSHVAGLWSYVHVVAAGDTEAEPLPACAETARLISMATHTHPLGLDGAVVQACAVSQALATAGQQISPSAFVGPIQAVVRTPEFSQLLRATIEVCEDNVPTEHMVARLGNGMVAHQSVCTALACFLRHPDSFIDVLREALLCGGDTDTIASMACAIAGARLGEDALPLIWREAVEDAQMIAVMGSQLCASVQPRVGR